MSDPVQSRLEMMEQEEPEEGLATYSELVESEIAEREEDQPPVEAAQEEDPGDAQPEADPDPEPEQDKGDSFDPTNLTPDAVREMHQLLELKTQETQAWKEQAEHQKKSHDSLGGRHSQVNLQNRQLQGTVEQLQAQLAQASQEIQRLRQGDDGSGYVPPAPQAQPQYAAPGQTFPATNMQDQQVTQQAHQGLLNMGNQILMSMGQQAVQLGPQIEQHLAPSWGYLVEQYKVNPNEAVRELQGSIQRAMHFLSTSDLTRKVEESSKKFEATLASTKRKLRTPQSSTQRPQTPGGGSSPGQSANDPGWDAYWGSKS